MEKFPDLIDAEQFTKFVKQYEKKYATLDRIYIKAIKDFKEAKLNELEDFNIKAILHSYLLKWGRMGRVLGYKGCSRIAEKLREMIGQFSEFQNLTLTSIDIYKKSGEIETLYNNLINAKWRSDKGRTKRVGPTATAKILHLVIPDLFMIWDSKIRKEYDFKDTGREYVRFLAIMKIWCEMLGSEVENLQIQYGKSITKLIDEYNWIKCWS